MKLGNSGCIGRLWLCSAIIAGLATTAWGQMEPVSGYGVKGRASLTGKVESTAPSLTVGSVTPQNGFEPRSPVGTTYSVSALLCDPIDGLCFFQSGGPDTVTFDSVAEAIPDMLESSPSIDEDEIDNGDGTQTIVIDFFHDTAEPPTADLFPDGFVAPGSGNPLTDIAVGIGLDDPLDQTPPATVILALIQFFDNGAPVTGVFDITAAFPPFGTAWNGVALIGFTGGTGLGFDEFVINLVVTKNFGFDDCNTNNNPDDDDIAGGTSEDANSNGTPDECEGAPGDCNTNGIQDIDELTPETDCNSNGTLDVCELVGGGEGAVAQDTCANAELVCPGIQYNGTTIGSSNDGTATCAASSTSPDVWYKYQAGASGTLTISLCGSGYDTALAVFTACGGTQLACNDDFCGLQSQLSLSVTANTEYIIRIAGFASQTGNFTMLLTGPDCGTSDCNGNGTLDECEPDCDGDGTPDDCEVGGGGDCNTNGTPDACDGGTDCNTNGLLDECDIAGGTAGGDCDGNGIPDDCDGYGDCNTNGTLDPCEPDFEDCNTNFIPDECELGRGEGLYCQAVILDDTGVGSTGLLATGSSAPQGFVAVDNFTLATGASINEVQWQSLSFGAATNCPGVDSIEVRIYASSGGTPTGAPLATWSNIPHTKVLHPRPPIFGIYPVYDNVGELSPAFQAQGGTEYWLAIIGDNTPGACPGTYGWLASDEQPPGDLRYFQDTGGGFVFSDADLAFCVRGGGGDCNTNGTLDVCEDDLPQNDCNTNQVPDECDPFGSDDCNTNGTPDTCDPHNDCNTNLMLDECEVAGGTAEDCNTNGTPDECEDLPDCNTNNTPDPCDEFDDCNTNGTPDECDLAGGGGGGDPGPGADLCVDAQPICPGEVVGTTIGATNQETCPPGSGPDVYYTYTPSSSGTLTLSLCGGATFDSVLAVKEGCNGPQIGCNDDFCGLQSQLSVSVNAGVEYVIRVDGFGTAAGPFTLFVTGPDCQGAGGGGVVDCNTNGTLDVCEGIPFDCNTNDINDECEPFGAGDCNNNGTSDACDVVQNDCNTNNVLDECDIAGSTSEDCNSNGTPDECEGLPDCNTSGTPDECEVFDDCNTNGTPDECELGGGGGGDLYCQAGILDDTGVGSTGLLATGSSAPQGFVAVDNFTLAAGANISEVYWQSLSFGASFDCPGADSVEIRMYADSGNAPSGPPIATWTNVPHTKTLNPRPPILGIAPVYDNVGTLNPPFQAQGGVQYWLAVIGDNTPSGCPGTYGWVASDEQPPGDLRYFQDTGGGFIFSDADLAFCVRGGGGDCNTNGTLDVCEDNLPLNDCNTNNTPDECDPFGSGDCNNNGTVDACDPPVDCNTNNVLDECDIAGGTSDDCNTNGTPDECEGLPDCNTNGTPDECDEADDCNTNLIPDECELTAGGMFQTFPGLPFGTTNVNSDINIPGAGIVADVDVLVDITHTWDSDIQIRLAHNAITRNLALNLGGSGDNYTQTRFDDEAALLITSGAPPFTGSWRPQQSLDVYDGGPIGGVWQLQLTDTFPGADNGTLNEYTLFIDGGGNPDCNTNGTLDVCEPDFDQHDCNTNNVHDACDPLGDGDCNSNGTPDACDETDCNTNNTLDECDIAGGASEDCNSNGIPDECEGLEDCNTNGTPDECDEVEDCNSNGVPDECDLLPPPSGQGSVAQDNCANAELVCPGITYTGSNVGANNDGTATCAASATSPDVWYRYIAGSTGSLTISLCGSGYDTALAVFTACGGTQLACNDDFCGLQSQLSLAVTANTEYIIRVSGFAGGTGSFTMLLTGPDCPVFTNPFDCNTNGTIDECEDPSGDCNTNGTPDECEGVAGDCNTNGTPDACDAGTDCNSNGQLDECDIGFGQSSDCNSNAIPDDCEPDCNANGTADECEAFDDCNSNGIPDECEAGFGQHTGSGGPVADAPNTTTFSQNVSQGGAIGDVDVRINLLHSWDSDLTGRLIKGATNRILMQGNGGSGDNFLGTIFDDEASTPISAGAAPFTGRFRPIQSLNAFDGQPAGGTWTLSFTDAFGGDTGFLQDWTLFIGVGTDCNTNGTPDDCDAAAGDDCNNDGIPDECQLTGNDCNTNGVPDECDIAGATSEDCNTNGRPDECDLLPAPLTIVSTIPGTFIDLSTNTGATDLLLGDDTEANVTMPFTNSVFTSGAVRVGNNGAICFNRTTGDVAITNTALPNNTAGGLMSGAQALCPFWDDLDSDFGAVLTQTVGTSPNRIFIVEWDNRPHFSGTTSGVTGATFQIQVFETPLPGNVYAQFVYVDTIFGGSHAGFDNGASATVGYQASGTGPIAQWSFNTASVFDGTVLSLIDPASQDVNGNGIPDECEVLCSCPGDMDGSGTVDGEDIQCFIDCLYGATPSCGSCDCADMDSDGDVDDDDQAAFVAALLAGGSCP